MLSESFAVLFFLKTPKKDSGQPRAVYIRITVDGIGREASVQRKCAPKLWEQKTGRSVGKDELSLTLNSFLNTIQARVEMKRTELVAADKIITAEAMIDFMKGRDTPKRYLMAEFQKHNDQQKILVEKKQCAEGTAERYDTALNHTLNFIKWKYGKEDILYNDLDFDFINDFYFYLMSERDCCNNTAIKYVTNMKKIVRIGLKKRYLQYNPFAEFEMHLDETEPDALNEREVFLIADKDYGIERLNQVRDVFLFSCMTGLAFADVEKLSLKDLETDEGNTQWIIQDRTKTKRKADIPLFTEAVKIIEKYKDHSKRVQKGLLLPVIANQNYNLYLKEIATVLHILKRITTHTARRTFASMCLNNGVDIKVISRMLGHKSVKQTEKYLRLEKDYIKKNMLKLQRTLNRKDVSFMRAIKSLFTPSVEKRVMEVNLDEVEAA